MNEFLVEILIFVIKLILLIGFILLVRIWLKKKKNLPPIITYWIFGLLFVFMMSSNIVQWLLMQFYYKENHLTRDKDSIGSISAIIGIVIYIFVGIKYFNRKKANLNTQ